MAEMTEPRNRNEEEIVGYRDVLATIHESHDVIPISPNVILQLHRDLCKHMSQQGLGGRWKSTENVISGTDATGVKRMALLQIVESHFLTPCPRFVSRAEDRACPRSVLTAVAGRPPYHSAWRSDTD